VYPARIVSTVELPEEVEYGVYEAYYELGDEAGAVSINPTDVVGESVADLRVTLQRMLRALDAPVLDYKTREEIK
jgi:hypothetical protein